jgi:hypothetical protein
MARFRSDVKSGLKIKIEESPLKERKKTTIFKDNKQIEAKSNHMTPASQHVKPMKTSNGASFKSKQSLDKRKSNLPRIQGPKSFFLHKILKVE